MARIARVVAPVYPHHITQRGNRRQQTFLADDIKLGDGVEKLQFVEYFIKMSRLSLYCWWDIHI